MGKIHKTKLAQGFGAYLHDKRVICLDLQDKYPFMDEGLIALLKTGVTPSLYIFG